MPKTLSDDDRDNLRLLHQRYVAQRNIYQQLSWACFALFLTVVAISVSLNNRRWSLDISTAILIILSVVLLFQAVFFRAMSSSYDEKIRIVGEMLDLSTSQNRAGFNERWAEIQKKHPWWDRLNKLMKNKYSILSTLLILAGLLILINYILLDHMLDKLAAALLNIISRGNTPILITVIVLIIFGIFFVWYSRDSQREGKT